MASLLPSLIDSLTHNLPLVDKDFLSRKYHESGSEITSRWLGTDIKTHQNLTVGGRLVVNEINSNAASSLSDYTAILSKRLKPEILNFIDCHKNVLQKVLEENKDLDNEYDFVAARKFKDTYLLKVKGRKECVENIQQCHLRLAIQLYHKDGLDKVLRCYNELARRFYTHATPTIFGAGVINGQMSSCFLLTCGDDTQKILNTYGRIAVISKNKGGIGLDISRIRHSEIGETGYSKGLPPLMYTIDALVKQFNQEGLRNGACTIYTRVHHLDLFPFCEAGLKSGDHYMRMHNINTALWTCWLFWKRVEDDDYWTLFCPNKTSDLNDIYGVEFNKRYEEYEKEFVGNPAYKKYYIRDKARNILTHITSCQCKSSMPYILHGDACNYKSNQKFLGYIRSSNLCLEIVEWASDDEIPSCNLASLSMKAFVKGATRKLTQDYDWDSLSEISRNVTENLNRVIDNNYTPLEEIKVNNDKYRPLGIGVTGLAEALYEMDLNFEDPLTDEFNKMFFACLYFNSLLESINESIKYGPHHRFAESPAAHGKLQFDLWHDEYLLLKEHDLLGKNPIRKEADDLPLSPSVWNQKPFTLINGIVVLPTWDDLKAKIALYGLRNSLTLALMPSATTSTIMMNTETTEAPTGNVYERRLMNGSFPVINKYLEQDARALGVWNDYLIQLLEADYGSVALLDKLVIRHPEYFPDFTMDWQGLKRLQNKYKTMWELPMRRFIKLAADRARYIDQSQSTNLYFADPTNKLLRAAHTTSFKAGLKTGMYYLRQLPAFESSRISVCPEILKLATERQASRNAKKATPVSTPSPLVITEKVAKVAEKGPNERFRNITCSAETCSSCQ